MQQMQSLQMASLAAETIGGEILGAFDLNITSEVVSECLI